MSLDLYFDSPLCVHCGQGGNRTSFNITHNLTDMAEAAGVYSGLWRPNENGITKAGQLVPILTEGLTRLKANPVHYHTFDSPNGWGTYDNFVSFVTKVLEHCEAHPNDLVSVWV